ncbi:MAG: hypothetical protein RLY57_429 [Candidatus Parcubacteria bacterium]
MIFTFNALALMFFFVLGAIIGSFLNVVIFRYRTGRSVNGRSGCLSCATQLKWYQMVPILSYLVLRGRCAKCQTKISRQYVLVELVTAVLFTAIAYVFFGLLTLGFVGTFFAIFSLYSFIACCAVVISVYDIRHMIIADPFAYAWIIAGIVVQALGIVWMGISSLSLLNIIAGPLFFIFFWSLWYFSKGTWMGGGDAKIGLAIGLTLGFSRGITAITLGFWIGAVYGIVLMILSRSKYLSKHIGLRTEVPFGPFLVLGFFLALLCNLDLVWMSGLFAF